MKIQAIKGNESQELSIPSASSPLNALASELSGRELDAAVAERVMGWWNSHGIWCRGEVGSSGNGTGWISYPVTDVGFQYAPETCVFAPSSNLAAAMEVVDHLIELGVRISMRGEKWQHRWRVCFYTGFSSCFPNGGPSAFDAMHESLPVAICCAALAAVNTQRTSVGGRRDLARPGSEFCSALT